MTAGGITVGMTISHGPGKIPDVFKFTAPDGYVMQPQVLTLDEFSTGQAFVVPWVGF